MSGVEIGSGSGSEIGIGIGTGKREYSSYNSAVAGLTTEQEEVSDVSGF